MSFPVSNLLFETFSWHKSKHEPLIIRRAVPTDAEALVAVQIAAFHHDSILYPEIELGGPPGYDSIDVMLHKIEQEQCYTMLSDGRCVGGMVVNIKANGHYHLDLIFVDPTHHNRGIGTQAMHFIEQTYPAAARWTLDTPQWAIRNQHFYEKLGYVNFCEYVEGGTPLILYEKRLG